MGKPKIAVYEKFQKKFYELTKKAGKEQYLVPYLISSHPGCTLNDAVELSVYLKKHKINPEQVQDFYPTPGTLATCMYYTEIDPLSMKPVYVAKNMEEKKMQRALIHFHKPENRKLAEKALRTAGREDLIPVFFGSKKHGGNKPAGNKSVGNKGYKKRR